MFVCIMYFCQNYRKKSCSKNSSVDKSLKAILRSISTVKSFILKMLMFTHTKVELQCRLFSEASQIVLFGLIVFRFTYRKLLLYGHDPMKNSVRVFY